MKCLCCEQPIKIDLKTISFLGAELFIQCPNCSELMSESDLSEELEIIRLTYDEK